MKNEGVRPGKTVTNVTVMLGSVKGATS